MLRYCIIFIAALVLCGNAVQSAPRQPSKPNIIIFLADDLGYGGLGIQGDPEAKTPNIDALMRSGVRMTDGYANHPVCSPSRAALLSGQYQHRFGFEHNSGSPERASPLFGVPREIPLLPERLKAAGYATGMFGKWHVGFKPDQQPLSRGFDRFYGFLSGAHAYVPALARRNRPMLDGKREVPTPPHVTEELAARAVHFIAANRDRPFFIYLPFNAVHSPMQTTDAYLARFAHVQDTKRRTHLAMLAALDDAVGKVMASLRDSGLERRTLVVFTSDNGGPTPETTSSNAPLQGRKGQVLEGGIRVPYSISWPGVLPANQLYQQPVIGFDITATVLAAAGASRQDGVKADGVDLLPYLLGSRQDAPHAMLVWRSGAQAAIRMGDWKLILYGDQRRLHNLASDIGERSNVIDAEAARAAAMLKAFDGWQAQMIAPRWQRNDLGD